MLLGGLATLLMLLALIVLVVHVVGVAALWPADLCRVLERLVALWPLRPVVLALALLCWPANVPAQDRSPILDRAIDIANGSAVVAHAADLSTTTLCLAAKTCVEANPLLVPHLSSPARFFAVKTGVALGSYIVKTHTKRDHPKLTLAFAVAENVALFWIAKHNYDVHQRARGR
jgi:Domain of unknown function (DUF5658)